MMSLREAAVLTGKSKSTLTRAIKAGRLSASRDAEGIYAIDPAELARVYPLVGEDDAKQGRLHDASRNGGSGPDKAGILQLELTMLREERERERASAERERDQLAETVADLRARLDRAEQRIIALMSDPKPSKKKSWWRWG